MLLFRVAMQSKCEWLLDVLWMRIQIVRKWIDKIGTRPPQQMRHFAAVTECFREVSMDTNLGAPADGSMSSVLVQCAWCAGVYTSMVHVNGTAPDGDCLKPACTAVLLSWIVSGGLWWHQPPV